MDKRPLKVFLCHAHADRDAVRALYARLRREGVDVWLDKEKLLPGADWEYEIRKAVREADVVVVCLSRQFNQAGFRQKEVRIALEAAMEKPEGEIFLIPARLEECDTLESLSRWHWVDLFESDGFQRLLMALRVRANSIGATLRMRRGGGGTTLHPKNNELETPAKGEQETAEERERQRAAAERARLEAEEAARQKAAKEDRQTAERLQRERIAREARERAGKPEPKKAAAFPKPNTAIIVALIGLIGTICAALISSPWLSNLFSRTPEPTAALSFTPAQTRTPAPSKTPTKAFTPTATPIPTQITDAKGIVMRLVPAGEFTMGSNDGYGDEQPVHQVYLDAFYMDIYEVTNAAYQACVKAGVCTPPRNTNSYTRSSYYGNSEFDDYPVIYVDWNQAKTYCKWRGARLPTEAEWEKAARGTEGRTYPWGNAFDGTKVNFCDKNCPFDWGDKNSDDGYADTAPVGSYESGKSPYGLYDMAGNVWEWTSSLYKNYPYVFDDGREDLNASGTRALRGGAWGDGESYLRASNRGWFDPSYFLNGVGFRCSRSLP